VSLVSVSLGSVPSSVELGSAPVEVSSDVSLPLLGSVVSSVVSEVSPPSGGVLIFPASTPASSAPGGMMIVVSSSPQPVKAITPSALITTPATFEVQWYLLLTNDFTSYPPVTGLPRRKFLAPPSRKQAYSESSP